MNIVLVCGGRDYDDSKRVYDVLSDLQAERGIDAIVHGDAGGADKLGGGWAVHNGVPEVRVPTNWTFYGKSAGPIRNEWMIELLPVNLVVAFPGGRGTASMVRLAHAREVEVIEVLRSDD